MLRSLYITACSLVITTLLFTHSVSAQQSVVKLDEVLNEALNNSVEIREIEDSFVGSSVAAIEAKTLSNPELEVSYGFGSNSKAKAGKDEIDISLQQPIKLSQLSLRSRLAELLEHAGNEQREKAVLGLLTKVKLGYARAWVIAERKALLKELSTKADSLNSFVKDGLSAGAYAAGESAVFQAEVLKLQAELKGLQAESLTADASLTQLVGKSFSGRKLAAPALQSLPEAAALKTKLDSAATTVQTRAKILHELASADAAVAQRDAFPELRPKLFYSRADDGGEFVGVGISFDLPFFNQNSTERMRTTSAKTLAASKQQFVLSDTFKSSILTAVQAYALRQEQVVLYRDQVLPALKRALGEVEAQARQGRGDIFSLWQTLREYLDTQQRYLELWTQAYSESNELSLLLEEEL